MKMKLANKVKIDFCNASFITHPLSVVMMMIMMAMTTEVKKLVGGTVTPDIKVT